MQTRSRTVEMPSGLSLPLAFGMNTRLHARGAPVGAALGIGMRQDVFAADLVVQGIEAITGFCLRFRVQRHLQLLNTFRSY